MSGRRCANRKAIRPFPVSISMTTRHLLLVRHGQTDYNLRSKIQGRGIDAPLNRTGERQADLLGDYLRRYAPGALHSSSLLRARQTAGRIAQAVQPNGSRLASAHPELDEMDFGRLEGVDVDAIRPRLDTLLQRWSAGDADAAAEQGESPRQVFERAHGRVLQLLMESSHEHTVFVLHGRLLRILFSQWIGEGFHAMDQFPHHNANVNHLVWNRDPALGYEGRFEAVYLNKTDHLDSVPAL